MSAVLVSLKILGTFRFFLKLLWYTSNEPLPKTAGVEEEKKDNLWSFSTAFIFLSLVTISQSEYQIIENA